jgi:membrane protein DedA with SNARE-associated domain
MTPLVESVKPYINHYGYWAVFFGIFFESLGVPLPGETLIIVAGLVAAKGVLNLTWVIALAVAATFISNNISYAAGYFGGHAFLCKYGKYIFLNENRIQALENFMKRHGNKVVVIARFIIGMRQFNGFIAGMAKMPFWKFALFNMLGAVLWVGWWTGLSYYFGKKFDIVFIKYYFLIGIFGLIVLILIASRFSKNVDNDSSLKNKPVS